MIAIDPAEHHFIPDSEVIRRIRAEVNRPDLIVYRNVGAGTFVLAIRYGSSLQEFQVLRGYPNISRQQMDDIRRQFNPDPRHLQAADREVAQALAEKRERAAANGRGIRRFWKWSKSKIKSRVQKDRPLYNLPKVPGLDD